MSEDSLRRQSVQVSEILHLLQDALHRVQVMVANSLICRCKYRDDSGMGVAVYYKDMDITTLLKEELQ